jgi:mannose-1-phosphate guanylyltransferase/mannose-6-phosphate isomerase
VHSSAKDRDLDHIRRSSLEACSVRRTPLRCVRSPRAATIAVTMRSVIPVILSGGSGTRLWPLSRADHPKQFLQLLSDRSLFQDTLLRLRSLRAQLADPVIVCNEAHRFLVAEQMREIGFAAHAIVLEPQARNTAPAATVAALLATGEVAGSDAEPVLFVLPADHVIGNSAAFAAAAQDAIEAATLGKLATFGIRPDRPETGYGYIRRGAASERWSDIDRFVEKPDLVTAQSYVASGDYLWNSGMFMFTAKTYLREIARHAPRILAACEAAVADAERDRDFLRLGGSFASCPSDSIDYAVAEKTDRAVVIELDAAWSDVGSWSALYDVLAKDDAGNVLRGNVLVDDCRNSYISADTRIVAAIGVDGVVIVATADAVLVMSREHAQRVKNVADALAAKPR